MLRDSLRVSPVRLHTGRSASEEWLQMWEPDELLT